MITDLLVIVVTHSVCHNHYKENSAGWYSHPARRYRISGRVVQLGCALCHEGPVYTKTAKLNNLNIYVYLETVLLYMPDYKNEPEGIEELMPWSDMVQQRCRIKSKS